MIPKGARPGASHTAAQRTAVIVCEVTSSRRKGQ